MIAGVTTAALVAAVAWLGRGGDAAPVQAATPSPVAAGPQFFGQLGSGDALAATPSSRNARLVELRQNFELVDQTYCNYAAGTKYPEASRPVSEHPDQIYPNEPVTESHAMRSGGGATDAHIQIQTSQSRVFMASGEAAAFSVRAVDTSGGPLPLVITRAAAQGMTFHGARPTTQITIPFADDGRGVFGGILAPAQTGLAGFNGTIRTEVRYTVGGKSGFVLFDVIYTPELPAVWSGQVREAVEEGSLVYYLKADVRVAGRYIVHGRVDDAKGKPFALATFNDTLASGPVEVKLTVFGKLLRDQDAALPLTLRDVDGYLLKEDVDPDRALMPRLEGKVLAGKPHPLKAFSDAEWQSEERTRHLVEFSKDVALAQGALSQFDPTLPVPKSACLN
ncbi:MAG: hypothetical protein V4484_18040 [Pseudomonadota bacterium]